MEEHLTCMCGWEGSPEELDEINEEIDVARAVEGCYLPDIEEAISGLGTPCCPICRQTYFGE